jgi:rubrerythrin
MARRDTVTGTFVAADMKWGYEYILRQTAEECMELALALLKLIRADRGETPVSWDEAAAAVEEELADAILMIDGLYTLQDPKTRARICRIRDDKEKRMRKRIEEAEEDAEESADRLRDGKARRGRRGLS